MRVVENISIYYILSGNGDSKVIEVEGDQNIGGGLSEDCKIWIFWGGVNAVPFQSYFRKWNFLGN